MFEGQFKGYQLKGFPFQADLDFSDDVFQKICVLKSNVRGKLQWLLSVSVSDEFLVPLPTLSTLLGQLSSLHRPLLQRIFPSTPPGGQDGCHRLGLGYSLLIASQPDGL